MKQTFYFELIVDVPVEDLVNILKKVSYKYPEIVVSDISAEGFEFQISSETIAEKYSNGDQILAIIIMQGLFIDDVENELKNLVQ